MKENYTYLRKGFTRVTVHSLQHLKKTSVINITRESCSQDDRLFRGNDVVLYLMDVKITCFVE